MKKLRKLWNATKEAVARLFRPRVQVVIREVVRTVYMWKPRALTVRSCKIDAATAAKHGQMSLFA